MIVGASAWTYCPSDGNAAPDSAVDRPGADAFISV
jgi:hypothetical protein